MFHFYELELIFIWSGHFACSHSLYDKNAMQKKSIFFMMYPNFLNPQTTVRGPHGPRNFLIGSSKVNIGIP